MTDPLRVLLIEDEEMDAFLLERELRRGGLSIVTERVDSEAALVDALRRQTWDLILSDYVLPGFSGRAALEVVRASGVDVPFILVSGTINEDIAVAAIRAGARDFVSKARLSRLVPAIQRELQDVADRRERARFRQAFDEAREHLDAVLGYTPATIVAVDLEGRIRFANRALGGRTMAQLLGTPWLDLMPVGEREALERALTAVLTEGAEQSLEIREARRDGTTTWSSLVLGPIRHGEGRRGAVICAQDVTALKRSEEQLRQADRMVSLGSLAAGIAHDFNNMLSVVTTFASFILEEFEPLDPRRRDVEEILHATDRAVALTRRLTAFARQQPRAPVVLDLSERVGQMAGLLGRTLGTSIQLEVRPARECASVSIDPVEFDQLVLNLLVNARDAMPNGGRLTLSVECPVRQLLLGAGQAPPGRVGAPGEPEGHGDDLTRVRLVVRDTGAGMDEATLARIFDPFFTTKDGKGTGLGLATCFNVVRQANGEIRAESVIGRGTAFIIDFPRAVPPSASAVVVAGPRGRGQVVLLATPDPVWRDAALPALRGAGFTVFVADDAAGVSLRAEQLGPRLACVVLDLELGADVARAAQAVARAAPQAEALVLAHTRSRFAHLALAGDELRGEPGHAGRPNELRREGPASAWVTAVADAVKRADGAADGVRAPAPDALVLIVSADDSEQERLASLLGAAGLQVAQAVTAAQARRVVGFRSHVAAVVCAADLPADDPVGDAGTFLEWLRDKHPTLADRVLVVADGVEGGVKAPAGPYPILRRPVDPRHVLDMIGRMAGDPEAAASTPEIPRTTSAGRVLLVDDEPAFLGAAGRWLTGADFDVVSVGTLEAARAQLRESSFDVIVVDLGLPDGDGLELRANLIGANAEVPMIVVTGSPSLETATRAVRGGVCEYLAKPFPSERLVRAASDATMTRRAAALRTKLLAARFGGDAFVSDLTGTARRFDAALQNLRIEYQPLVRARDHALYGFEALLRSDEETLATPARLFAAAEVLGRVAELGRAARRVVAQDLLLHPERREDIFVNVHPSELQQGLLLERGDPLRPLARRVVLEVTERGALENAPRLQDELARVRAAGYRIAVDDLGEGYAGLASLARLHPDMAKIDISLVRDVQHSPLKRDIVAAIVDLARRASMLVVAEGVEFDAEATVLAGLGCDLLQGYRFGRPGPAFPV